MVEIDDILKFLTILFCVGFVLRFVGSVGGKKSCVQKVEVLQLLELLFEL